MVCGEVLRLLGRLLAPILQFQGCNVVIMKCVYRVILLAASVALLSCDGEGSASQTAGSAAGPGPTPSVVETEFDYALDRALGIAVRGAKGIGIDGAGRLYVAGQGGVSSFTPEGELHTTYSTSGPATCVAIGSDGMVYVGLEARIETFDGDGNAVSSWGEKGERREPLRVVTAIGVHGTRVFVADAGSRCIHVFDTTGDPITEFGKRDMAEGIVGLICPSPYLDVDPGPDGGAYVTNPGMLRVETYSRDGGLVGFWGQGGTDPEDFTGCCNPTNVLRMSDGNFATAEKQEPRVKVYSPEGEMLAFIGPEHFDPDAAGLDMAQDSSGALYVLDPAAGKVLVFRRAVESENQDTE
jgi:DNA-binding beta-propeller fold protein YncE